MSVVIKIEYLGGTQGRSGPSEHEGRFVSRFDADAHEGRGHVWTVANPYDALKFDDFAQALAFYRQVSSVRPTREDGQPNRPLTAFTVQVSEPEKDFKAEEVTQVAHHMAVHQIGADTVVLRDTLCPDCGSSKLEMRNYEMMWHEGDIHCANCGKFIRRFDAG